MFKFDTTLHRLRSVGAWEALSYLLLLGVASLLPFGPFVADARLLRKRDSKASN
ncbi:MAG: hypothetical protein ACI81V_000422 [Lentimonas sp.]|jgi:hypothetical protein